MSASKNSTKYIGADWGTFFFLFIQTAFILGKSFGFLEWTWWQVFIPSWILLALVIVIVLIALLVRALK